MPAKTHGLSNTAEYRIWTDIKTRCYNKNYREYQYYGGRGITVCQRWCESFENFLADIGPRPSPRHSIDRFPDNDGNYEPANCRWATDSEQANNKRNNIFLTVDGITKTLPEWCRNLNISYDAAKQHYRSGYTGKDILTGKRVLLSHNGLTDTLLGWSRRTGILPSTLFMRINKYGWSIDRALTTGVRH